MKLIVSTRFAAFTAIKKLRNSSNYLVVCNKRVLSPPDGARVG